MGGESITATLAFQGMGLCQSPALLTAACLQGLLFLHGFSVFPEYGAESVFFIISDAHKYPFPSHFTFLL